MPLRRDREKEHRERIFAAYQKMNETDKAIALALVVFDGIEPDPMIPWFAQSDLNIIKSHIPKRIQSFKDRDLLRGAHYASKFSEDVANLILRETVGTELFKDMATFAIKSHQDARSKSFYSYKEPSFEELRLRAFMGDDDILVHGLVAETYNTRDRFVSRFLKPWDPAWVARQSPTAQRCLWRSTITRQLNEGNLDEASWQNYLKTLPEDETHPNEGYPYCHAHLLVQRGDLRDAETFISKDKTSGNLSLRAAIAFMRGEASLKDFDAGLKALRKETGERKLFWPDYRAPLHIVALLADGSEKNVRAAIRFANSLEYGHPLFDTGLNSLHKLSQCREDPSLTTTVTRFPRKLKGNAFVIVFELLATFWINKDLLLAERNFLDKLLISINETPFDYLRFVMTDLMLGLGIRRAEMTEQATALLRDGYTSPRGLLKSEEPWRLAIRELIELAEPETKKEEGGADDVRFIWLLEDNNYHINLSMVEQKMSKKGWTKGKKVSIKAALNNHKYAPFLSEADQAILKTADTVGYNPILEEGPAMLGAVGHPHIYLEENRDARVNIEKADPEIIVENKPDHLYVEFFPKTVDDIVVIRKTPTHYDVVQITAEQRRASNIIGSGLRIPKDGADEVLAMIQALSGKMVVKAELTELNQDLEMEQANGRLMAQLFPQGIGFKMHLRVRPFTDFGPTYYPGSGTSTVIARQGKRTRVAKRDLAEEVNALNHFMDVCPTVADEAEVHGEWFFDDPELCLQVLLELEQMGEDLLIMWPQGKSMKVYEPSISNMRVAVGKQATENNWFSVDGDVTLDQETVVTLQRLLKLADETKGRFVALGDNQFMALTQSFRRRLAMLKHLTSEGRGGGINHLGASALEEALRGAEVDRSELWQAALKRREKALAFEPKLPRIEADLRAYQVEGFAWLARLASWGVGACLADDMGLGKTVQALALMRSLAKEGPMLVIAPTSVCGNWIREANRFTPDLQVERFGARDRQKQLDELGPFKVLVTSYGIMQNEAERLQKVKFRTIVLDEAQAIKNAGSLRARAVHELQGDFRLLLTGTPLENNLSELWSLFRFINPGLLGNHNGYVRRFVTPIEKYNDETARNSLKKMVQPFILRRLKSEVLEELPARTEITMRIEPNDEEAAFYEAVRRSALELLDEAKDKTENHIRILSQIMRLRRACCNPRLLDDETDVQSSKLQRFGAVVQDLIQGNHRALVFSQFVDHLQILKSELDRLKVSYQYLDGSTSAKARQQAVDDFQAGEGDIFLISLKAGGTGLNLTAADYVIHMDPWWNPAVEDQATDRAYRMGQERPVTIYRFVMADTIEEKIVALHAKKRDLADSLLEGTDASARLSAQDMLKLFR